MIEPLEIESDSLKTLGASLAGRKIDAVIDAAWLPQRPDIVGSSQNTEAAQAMCERAAWAAGQGAKIWIGFGTCLEYGLSSPAPVAETSPVNPRSPYAEAKIATYKSISAAHGDSMRIVWARPFYVFGSGDHLHRLLPDAAHALSTGGSYDLKTPEYRLDFVDVRDVAEAVVRLLSVEHRGPVNIGTGRMLSVLEMATWVWELTGRRGQRPQARNPAAKIRMESICADIRLLSELIKWTPSVPTRKSVADAIAPWIRP